MAKKNELTKAGDQVPATYDYGDEVGAGLEGAEEILVLPFLNVLQSNSPQVDSGDPKYIPGAKAGMLINNVTNELIDGEEGVLFIPVHWTRSYVEWVPRDAGGGFVGRHTVDSQVVLDAIKAADGKRFGKLSLPNGHDLIETNYVYIHLLDEKGGMIVGSAVLSFTSTKIKPFRNWFSSLLILKGKPPLYANRARLTTFKDKNKKGQFYNFKIEPMRGSWLDSLIDPQSERELLEIGRALRESVLENKVQAATDMAHEEEAEKEEDGEEIFG